MQCAAGEIRGKEPGDAGLALKAENFTNGCAAAGRTLSAAAQLLGLNHSAGTLFLLPLSFCHNRFISSEYEIYFH